MNTCSRICLLALSLVLLPALARADKPNWAKKSVGFAGTCSGDCRTQRIVAPDKRTTVEVLYQNGIVYLRVTAPDQPAREIHDVVASPHNDLLWAPDSKAFLINASEGMSSPSFVQVYLLDDMLLRPVDVTHQAERDLVKTYPPCKAIDLDPMRCRKIVVNPEYNITAFDWVEDSSALVVKVQVPCTTEYGGILCQMMGYVVEVPSGDILKRMTPAEFKKEWQKSMEQRLQIPEPPQYQQ